MSRYRNTTNQPLVYDSAGHQVDGFGVTEADANDSRTSRHISSRRLVLVAEPVNFLEAPEPGPAERESTVDADEETATDDEPTPETYTDTKPRNKRNRSNQKGDAR